jgi:predicted HicB family RNase H-like nuclease
LFHSEIIDLRAVVSFQGMSVEELEGAFRDSVDDSLEFREERDQRFSGPRGR